MTGALEPFTAALEGDQIDLILCDYSLPGFDGLKGLRMAGSKPPEVSCIMFSGSVVYPPVTITNAGM